jgi:hypothetical protein
MIQNADGSFTFSKDETLKLVEAHERAREYLDDIYQLRDVLMKTCHAFKITTPDGKNIRPSILDKSENPIKSLAKGGISFIGNMTMAAAGMESAVKEIENSFGFLGTLGPMFQKYGGSGERLIEEKADEQKQIKG